ncbi:MAG: hypothetical protein F2799_06195 [Actinobacteria bacterium]|uniref:Unannotated protein n=1 Tax=freshwater metagenome TaxID=449393 RepID=A0A6J7EFI6_9ZZZZ|nr:hypothetical protein [Actinomycetota bacterium]
MMDLSQLTRGVLAVSATVMTLTPATSAASQFPLARSAWLDGFTLTEYWPAPERWFRGAKVVAPGLTKAYPVDFLYSAMGVAMEGDGVGVDGSRVHLASGLTGYVNAKGVKGGTPYWANEMFWLNSSGLLTFPLQAGGWSNGAWASSKPTNKVNAKLARFEPGPSLGASGAPLRSLASVAVDPKVIAYRSAVYLSAYDRWFCAADTGGAIVGRHLDVFRDAPTVRAGGTTRLSQRIRVLIPADARKLLPLLCR